MHGTGEDGMMAREISNVRFLIEQQLRLIDELERFGRDSRAAHELLRRLMRRDEDLRRSPAAAAAQVLVA